MDKDSCGPFRLDFWQLLYDSSYEAMLRTRAVRWLRRADGGCFWLTTASAGGAGFGAVLQVPILGGIVGFCGAAASEYHRWSRMHEKIRKSNEAWGVFNSIAVEADDWFKRITRCFEGGNCPEDQDAKDAVDRLNGAFLTARQDHASGNVSAKAASAAQRELDRFLEARGYIRPIGE